MCDHYSTTTGYIKPGRMTITKRKQWPGQIPSWPFLRRCSVAIWHDFLPQHILSCLDNTSVKLLTLKPANRHQRSLLILSLYEVRKSNDDKQIRRPGGVFGHLLRFTIRDNWHVYARRHTCNWRSIIFACWIRCEWSSACCLQSFFNTMALSLKTNIVAGVLLVNSNYIHKAHSGVTNWWGGEQNIFWEHSGKSLFFNKLH